MNDTQLPDEVKILHIHQGNEEKKDFIEFMLLKDGFVKRYGSELVDEFRALKAQ